MALRALSLCAGIGGIDLGLRGVARTVCYVEREAFAAAILRARMQDGSLDDAPIWSDLGTFDACAWRGAVDLVTGGYPCQPFSFAGKRRGEDDERHLWPHVRRIIDECGAPLVFLENVSGHLHLGFADVLADIASLGFDAEWGLFTAREVGAPHKRERLFVLAYRDRDGLREQSISERWRSGSTFPPGPSDRAAWERWIASGGPQPAVRRDADGISNRLDRLRALGNAVVPQVAAQAFAELARRVTA